MKSHVLVAGAGPVGLSVALALARKGFRVDVFEAGAKLADEARASTMHAPTLEMFEEWGVADEIVARGNRVDRLQFWERESATLVAELPYSLIADDTRFPFRLQCPQHHATPILLRALLECDDARIHFGHKLVRHSQTADRVIAVFETADGNIVRDGDYLIGADGAASLTREGLGLVLEGATYEDRFLLVGGDFDVARSFAGVGPVAYVFDPREWVIFMQLPDLLRIVFRLAPDEDAEVAASPEAVHARLHALLGADARFEIEMTSIYRVHRRVAQSFRQGRVLLAGDAAHINNPAGGMGMNSGIHDAWALAHALDDGSDRALDHYAETRRRAALESVQTLSDANYKNLAVTDTGERTHRNRDLADTAADPTRARELLLKLSMLDQAVGRRAAA